jgi:hypothetical protein
MTESPPAWQVVLVPGGSGGSPDALDFAKAGGPPGTPVSFPPSRVRKPQRGGPATKKADSLRVFPPESENERPGRGEKVRRLFPQEKNRRFFDEDMEKANEVRFLPAICAMRIARVWTVFP